MNWIVLKALNELYQKGEVRKNETLLKSGELSFLINSLNVISDERRNLVAIDGYAKVYENKYRDRFNLYLEFLNDNGLLKPQTRFEESDIQILMKIKSWREEGTLEELRAQIISSDESLRGVSLMFFKHEKYLDDKTSLIEALKKIIDVAQFSNEKDQQYIYRLEVDNPMVIVLCENVDFLTKPNKPRLHGIELWYAGGKNVDKLRYADHRGLPIYYSCDWDYDGLYIIYPLVKNKIPAIRLLTPDGAARGIIETEHKSLWKQPDQTRQVALSAILEGGQEEKIQELVQKNQWVIEESNSLLTMLNIS